MTNIKVSVRRMLVSIAAASAIAGGGLVAISPADAAYAPTAALSNYSPKRCGPDFAHAFNFPHSRPIAVYTFNHGRIVPLARKTTNSRGEAIIRFRVLCTLTLGFHPLTIASGRSKTYLAINVRRAR